MQGKEHAFVLVRDWLGETPVVDRDRALAELARRYLLGHGPASDGDLARWSGLPLRDARAGLGAIASQLRERLDGLVELASAPPPEPLPPPRLLGPFDPLLLGWCSREELLAGNQQIVTVNGVFRPFALVGGKAVAMWSLVGGKVELRPFGKIAKTVERSLERDAEDVLRYLGSA